MDQQHAEAAVEEFTPTRDVTKEFTQVCAQLGNGEMVRSQDFDLSRAISYVSRPLSQVAH